MTDASKRGLRTRLSHTGRAGKRVHGFVDPPLQRGSTVLYPTVAERRAIQRGAMSACWPMGWADRKRTGRWRSDRRSGRRHALRHRLFRSRAVTTPLLAFLKTGDHCLMPDSVYGPARNFCDGVLKRFGVETTSTIR